MDELLGEMTQAAEAFVAGLDERQRDAVRLPFAAEDREQWTYLPGERAGLKLAQLDPQQRRAGLRLLWLALAPHAFAQATTIMALDDVLAMQQPDRAERGAVRYTFAVYGDPGADAWAWRLEGHHLSANVTVVDGRASATPLFLGANPARTRHGDADVVRPLPREEDLARTLLRAIPRDQRARAVVADHAPGDLETSDASDAAGLLQPAGLPLTDVDGGASDLVDALVDTYRGRLAPALTETLPPADQLHLAWSGGLEPGQPHTYRLQGGDFLVEYANTQNGANHIHSVIRHLGDDFGRTLLARHHAAEA